MLWVEKAGESTVLAVSVLIPDVGSLPGESEMPLCIP